MFVSDTCGQARFKIVVLRIVDQRAVGSRPTMKAGRCTSG